MPKEIEIPDIPLSQWNGLRSVAQARKNPVPTSYAALSLFVTALMSRWQRSNKSSDKNMLRILETVKTFELYYQATGRNTETDDDYFLSILRPELMQIGLAPLTDRVADHDAAMIKLQYMALAKYEQAHRLPKNLTDFAVSQWLERNKTELDRLLKGWQCRCRYGELPTSWPRDSESAKDGRRRKNLFIYILEQIHTSSFESIRENLKFRFS